MAVDPGDDQDQVHWSATLAAVVATIIGVASVFSAINRVIQTRSSCDVSVLGVGLRIMSVLLWAYYAMHLAATAKLVNCMLLLGMLVAYVFVIRRYAKPDAACLADAPRSAATVPSPAAPRTGQRAPQS